MEIGGALSSALHNLLHNFAAALFNFCNRQAASRYIAASLSCENGCVDVCGERSVPDAIICDPDAVHATLFQFALWEV